MTNNLTEVLSAFAEAKRALDAEPQYRSTIHELETRNHHLGETIAKRELHIHELKQTEENLIRRLREVEAERDDAGFRLLEETDKVSALSSLVRQYIGDAIRALATVEGKPPQVLVADDDYKALVSANRDLDKRIGELEYERDAAKADNETTQAALRSARDEIQATRDSFRAFTAPPPVEPYTAPAYDWGSGGEPKPAEGQSEPPKQSETSSPGSMASTNDSNATTTEPTAEVQSAIPPSQPATTTMSSDTMTGSGGIGQGQTGESVKTEFGHTW